LLTPAAIVDQVRSTNAFENPPWAKMLAAFCRSWHIFCRVRGTAWVKANDRARINRPYTFHGG
jgi:hypothetical protein